MNRPHDAPSNGPSRRPSRSWTRAATLALAAVYVPQLLPLVATDLLEHGHCLASYGRIFPILIGLGPGLRAQALSHGGEPGSEIVLFAVAIAVTLATLGGIAVALRRLRRVGVLVAALAALLSAFLSMAAVAILRA